ncbi:calcium-dependent phosphotriesterase [Massarina eburnea CBS 473.64]|uniref:Calcium-dependent phosphotriesterase n=1 Tax=Massarina eburnea CBS 473.64 TaxID=1395130 RepID=A0A6A6RWL6_9PLEO|nr:calcium-dependent phosphotriesterase [Massarina eburnea CBS 473.64]
MAHQEDFPFAYRGAVYVPDKDFVFTVSNQFTPPGTDIKSIAISQMARKPDGSWTRQEVAADVRMASGAINYDDGILFCAQGDHKDAGGLIHMEGNFPYRTRTLLNNYYGRPFNSIKELAIHSDGSIWFTDPVYGYEQGIRPAPQLPNQVYRFDPKNGDVRVMADAFGRPSGICFSPDEEICYISDTDCINGNGQIDFSKPATIYAYDVEERRQTKWLLNRRVFAMADVGVPDGIACDMSANVYAACADGLSVWSSGGIFLSKVILPSGIANFCFGKDGEIFLLNGKKFWVLNINDSVRGALLERRGINTDLDDSGSE